MAKRSNKNSRKFAGIPVVVMESPDYIALGPNAIRLLIEMAGQYNGFNNGDLSPSYTLMNPRGFKSKGTLTKAIRELTDAHLIILTRQGGRNNTASLYALTWEPIHDLPKKRLELGPTRTPTRKFELERLNGWTEALARVAQKLGKSGPVNGPTGIHNAKTKNNNWASHSYIAH